MPFNVYRFDCLHPEDDYDYSAMRSRTYPASVWPYFAMSAKFCMRIGVVHDVFVTALYGCIQASLVCMLRQFTTVCLSVCLSHSIRDMRQSG